MALRDIITIDESLCDGCGECITACAEGALALVGGKARVVKDQFCDGFGDCVGHCPTGALTVEKRDASAFDLAATAAHVHTERGESGLEELARAHQRHGGAGPAPTPLAVLGAGAGPGPGRFPPPGPHGGPGGGGGCPGSRMRFPGTGAAAAGAPAAATPTPTRGGGVGQAIPSELRQWPLQLHLVPPGAPFFQGRELALMADCVPFASADAHWRFLRGRGIAIACPKLDDLSGYVEKLAQILSEPTIPRVLVVRMEVPCCGGLTAIAREAVRRSGRADLELEEVIVTLDGAVPAP